MLQLPNPTVVGAVTIDIASTGTKVEIRSASHPVAVGAGGHHGARRRPRRSNPVTTPSRSRPAAPTSNLLVWISTLGTTDGKSQAGISEITVQAAS